MNRRSDEQRIRDAILWRLWLPPYSTGEASREDAEVAKRDWQLIWAWLGENPKRVRELAEKMIDPLVETIEYALTQGSRSEKKGVNLPARWERFYKFICRRIQSEDHRVRPKPSELPGMMSNRATTFIPETVFRPSAPAAPPRPAPQTQSSSRSESGAPLPAPANPPATAGNPARITMPMSPTSGPPPAQDTPLRSGAENRERKNIIDLGPVLAGPETTPMPSTDQASETVTNDAGEAGREETKDSPEPAATNTPSLSPQWKWLPLPDEPARHDEFHQEVKNAPDGLKLIGARVRGKKHKHEGTNCDDWFEFAVNGPWTIIAVSDGAGSRKFSRIGAKVACSTAVNYLKEKLEDCRLDLRQDLTNDSFRREGGDWHFVDDDLQVAQRELQAAVREAHAATLREAEFLKGRGEYKGVLGRELEFEDLSATLLVAVHTAVTVESNKLSFVLACQIGDGMLGVIDDKGGLQLLGEADSGEFAGQTDFLTNRKKLEPESLASKTFAWSGKLQDLLVMTDGVADDYYPNQPGLQRLYGDLALNGIIELSVPSEDETTHVLGGTELKTKEGVFDSRDDFSVQGITATAGGHERVTLLSAAAYAEKLGLRMEYLIQSRSLLTAGARAGCLHDKGDEAERLRWWLDTYQVRGSFDDRTLVILHKGNGQ